MIECLALNGVDERYRVERWDEEAYARLLPLPAPDANKYTRGMVSVVAGSQAYPGAAVLAASGAVRSGAGYVTLFTPGPVVTIAQVQLPMVPVRACPSKTGAFRAEASEVVLSDRQPQALVFGPGVTVTDDTSKLERRLLKRLDAPLVIDADGLNALAAHRRVRDACSSRPGQTVLTPHVGEMRRLLDACDLAAADVRLADDAERVRLSCGLSERLKAVVVLKGPRTVVASDTRAMICDAGTPALATAGTGDVLAGMVGAFLAQGLDAFHAAALSVYLHGRAGCVAAAHRGPIGVTAIDVAAFIGEAAQLLLGNG
jgi:hydroxyethylthiazole kinase-like uncharacterized protein yjeF